MGACQVWWFLLTSSTRFYIKSGGLYLFGTLEEDEV